MKKSRPAVPARLCRSPFESLLLRRAPVVALLMASGAAMNAANITWDGGTGGTGTSWDDAVNWSGDIVPATGDSVVFNGTNGLSAGKVITFSSSPTVDRVWFDTVSNSFILGSSGQTINLTNVSRTGWNGYPGASSVQTFAANVNLIGDQSGVSTWQLDSNSNNGGYIVSGVVSSTGDVTLRKSGGGGTLTMNNANTFTGSVLVEAGTLSLGGTNAYTGSTAVSGGTIQLNFNAGASSPLTNIVNSASGLVLGGVRGGGTLTVNGKNAANSVNSQTFSGTTINAGASTLNIVNGISSGKTSVDLGAITRNAGGTVNFVQPTVNTTISAQNGYVTSSANDASGILGAWATVGGTEYATNNGTNIVAYTGYTDQAGNVMADGATTNLRITSGTTGNITQNAGTTTINTLRVNDAAARIVTVGAGNTLRLNGVLATGTNGLTIGEVANAGSLTAGSADNTAGELIINNTTAMTVNSQIVDNGTGAVALTKAGSGTLTLGASNSYTGGTYVNAGTLALSAGATDQFSTSGAIVLSGGTLNLGTGSSQTTSGSVVVAGGTLSNGTLTKTGANYDLRNGTISTKLAGSVGIDKTTSGTLTLSNTSANTFTGTTTITEGAVIGGAGGDVVSIGGNLVVGSENGGNAASYTNSGSNRGISTTANITVYSNGTVSLGTGAQGMTTGRTITIIGGTFDAGQQFFFDTSGGSNIIMTGGVFKGNLIGNTAVKTFQINASSDVATMSGNVQRNVNFNVADGAASTDLAVTGIVSGSGITMTKSGAGMLVSSGSSSYTGATTLSGGTLGVTTLTNGGSSSSIGSSTNAATNLRLADGTTLRYTGTGHSTDRLFTVNGSAADHSATLEASGTGAVNFTNTGNIAWGTTNQTRTLKLGGTNTANNTFAATLNNNGTGLVSLVKQDAGKWIISGTNSYTGATTVNGGSLIVNGSLASGSAVTVNSGGTLGGSGTIGGSVTVESGGFLAPGNSPGILTVGSLNLAAGSTTSLEIAGAAVRGTDFDGINITTASGLTYGGTLNLAFTSTLTNDDTLDLFSFTGTAGGSFTSVVSTGNYAGTWTGDNGVWTFESNGQLLTFTQATGDLSVVAGALIPEPSTFALVGGLLALGAVTGRRRRA